MSRRPTQEQVVTQQSNSRRNFLRFASMAAAAPILTEAHFAWAAQQSAQAQSGQVGQAPARRARQAPPAGAVLINANENPLGPCKAACEIIASIAPMGGRYDFYGETDKLTRTFAQQNKLKEEYVAVYGGSSDPLHFSVLAFTSPTRGFVSADPSYEAPVRAAKVSGAKISMVPLTKDYAHDIKAMIAADPNAGVIYICNPNNPTGTLTSKADIAYALEHKPKGSILLVDEAYIHLSDAENVLDFVAADKDLIVLRTFSKIYGMAGIRCGIAAGRPDLLAKLPAFGQNPLPITGCAAANVSLLDAELVPQRKAIIGATRKDTLGWLRENGYKVVGDPQSNCFMIETGRPGGQVVAAMRDKNVFIGRVWPVWPNAVRVSVGTPEEMAKFKVAWKQVMDAPAKPAMASVHVEEFIPYA